MKKILMMFVAMLCSLNLTSIKAEEVDVKYEIKAYYLQDNQPVEEVQIVAKNYQLALEKIMSGKITDELEHYSVDTFKKKGQFRDNNTIVLGEGLIFGEGVQVSKTNAEKIIQKLYLLQTDFLDLLNDYTNNSSALVNPDKPSLGLTNSEGISVGEITQGATIFVTSDKPRNIYYYDIKKNSTLYLGNTLFLQYPIEVSSKNVKSSENISVDFGEIVEYKIPIKDFKELTIKISPNFIVTESSHNYTSQYVDDLLISDGSILYDYTTRTDEYEISLSKISEELSEMPSIKQLRFEFSDEEREFLTIKGYVTSKLEVPVLVNYKNLVTNEELARKEVVTVFNSNSNQGIIVYDDTTAYKTPTINSYGINFVNYDKYNNGLLSGVSSLLVRENLSGDKEVFLLGQDNPWNPIDSFEEIKDLDNRFYLRGNMIVFGDGHVEKFTYNRDIWAYSEENQQDVFKSLLKLRGFSSNFKYTLIPAEIPTEYKLSSGYDFYLSESSITDSKRINYQINGEIIDFKYAEEEYHAIGFNRVNLDSKKDNSFQIITIATLAAIIIIIGILYLINFKF